MPIRSFEDVKLNRKPFTLSSSPEKSLRQEFINNIFKQKNLMIGNRSFKRARPSGTARNINFDMYLTL